MTTQAKHSAGIAGRIDFPESLLHVPGFIGDVMAYTLATAKRADRVLALSGAMALQAVLAGRKVRDENEGRTNVYLVVLANTCSGKEHVREVNKRILAAAGAETLLAADFASGAAINTALSESPTLLWQVDEFGRYLQTAESAERSPHRHDVVSALLQLRTSAASVYLGKAYADKDRRTVVQQPCLVALGTSTRGQFFDAIKHGAIENGFLGRISILERIDDGRLTLARGGNAAIPDSIVERARNWFKFDHGKGNLSAINPTPAVVPRDTEAQSVLDSLIHRSEYSRIQAERAGNEWQAALNGRTVEKAMQFALLYACSRSLPPGAVVDGDAMRWGAGLSEFLTFRLVELAAENMSNGKFDATCQAIRKAVRDADGDIPHRPLRKATRQIEGRAFDEAVKFLIETGEIHVAIKSASGRGRPATCYRLGPAEGVAAD